MGFEPEPQRRGASSFKVRCLNHSATEAPNCFGTNLIICICFQWYNWSEIFGAGKTGGFAYVIKYFLYVSVALSFGLMAAMFVRVFAPYACGSGIPEVSETIF